VVRLARAAGKRIPPLVILSVSSTLGKTASGTSSLLTFGAPVLLVALAAGLVTLMRRRARFDRHAREPH
jgi:hypothetical protein